MRPLAVSLYVFIKGQFLSEMVRVQPTKTRTKSNEVREHLFMSLSGQLKSLNDNARNLCLSEAWNLVAGDGDEQFASLESDLLLDLEIVRVLFSTRSFRSVILSSSSRLVSPANRQV